MWFVVWGASTVAFLLGWVCCAMLIRREANRRALFVLYNRDFDAELHRLLSEEAE